MYEDTRIHVSSRAPSSVKEGSKHKHAHHDQDFEINITYNYHYNDLICLVLSANDLLRIHRQCCAMDDTTTDGRRSIIFYKAASEEDLPRRDYVDGLV